MTAKMSVFSMDAMIWVMLRALNQKGSKRIE